jgi:hypothetical protein
LDQLDGASFAVVAEQWLHLAGPHVSRAFGQPFFADVLDGQPHLRRHAGR